MNIPKGIRYVIGIDEAGRGPLAGPIALGVFCVPIEYRSFKRFSLGVRDSKKLTAKKRELWFDKILSAQKKEKISFAVVFASSEMIDTKGLTFATKQALKEALGMIEHTVEKTLVLLDGGLRAPKEYLNQITIIHGDDIESVISLASITAKVTRDKYMTDLSKNYPQYGFARHNGYGTKAHYEAIEKYGIIEGIHRKSFLKKYLLK